VKPVQRRKNGFDAASYARSMQYCAPFIAAYQDHRLLNFFAFDSLRKRVGERLVRVTRSLNSAEEAEIELSSYLEYVQSESTSDDKNTHETTNDGFRPWYLLRASDRSLVRGVDREWLPEFFRFNILNGLPDDSGGSTLYTKDWLFLGPANSVSELHFDHHFVHTILVQCEGRKRVRLVDDRDWSALETSGARANSSEWDGLEPVPAHLKAFVYECILEKGDFIFIPAGWYHGVLNLSASSTYSYDYVDCTNVMRWLPEALTDEVYREFFIQARGGAAPC